MSENTLSQSILIPISLSAFGLPGVGHWYLKRTKSAVLYIAITLALLVVIFTYIYTIVRDVLNNVLVGGISIDVDQIKRLTHQALSEQNDLLFMTALIALCVVWVVAILDIIRMHLSSKSGG